MDRDAARQVGLTAYILYAASAIIAPAAIAGVIYAHIKRDDVDGSFVASHITWLIRTFWLTLLFGLIGLVLALFVIGFVILFAVGVWYIFRVVKGFVIFADGKPIADPQSLF